MGYTMTFQHVCDTQQSDKVTSITTTSHVYQFLVLRMFKVLTPSYSAITTNHSYHMLGYEH